MSYISQFPKHDSLLFVSFQFKRRRGGNSMRCNLNVCAFVVYFRMIKVLYAVLHPLWSWALTFIFGLSLHLYFLILKVLPSKYILCIQNSYIHWICLWILQVIKTKHFGLCSFLVLFQDCKKDVNKS